MVHQEAFQDQILWLEKAQVVGSSYFLTQIMKSDPITTT